MHIHFNVYLNNLAFIVNISVIHSCRFDLSLCLKGDNNEKR